MICLQVEIRKFPCEINEEKNRKVAVKRPRGFLRRAQRAYQEHDKKNGVPHRIRRPGILANGSPPFFPGCRIFESKQERGHCQNNQLKQIEYARPLFPLKSAFLIDEKSHQRRNHGHEEEDIARPGLIR